MKDVLRRRHHVDFVAWAECVRWTYSAYAEDELRRTGPIHLRGRQDVGLVLQGRGGIESKAMQGSLRIQEDRAWVGKLLLPTRMVRRHMSMSSGAINTNLFDCMLPPEYLREGAVMELEVATIKIINALV